MGLCSLSLLQASWLRQDFWCVSALGGLWMLDRSEAEQGWGTAV